MDCWIVGWKHPAQAVRQVEAVSGWRLWSQLTQGETGDRKGCCGRFIFRSQVSAVGYQVQVFRCGYRSRA